MSNEEETVGVVFNGAFAYLERIHNELREFNFNYKEGNIDNMKTNMDLLYMEIHPKLKPDEREIIKKLLNITSESYDKWNNNPRQVADVLSNLINLKLKLTEFLEKYNFLMPNAEDPRFAAYH